MDISSIVAIEIFGVFDHNTADASYPIWIGEIALRDSERVPERAESLISLLDSLRRGLVKYEVVPDFRAIARDGESNSDHVLSFFGNLVASFFDTHPVFSDRDKTERVFVVVFRVKVIPNCHKIKPP